MGTSILVVFLSCMLINLGLNTAQMCSDTGNFTTNSTYGKNRNLALSSLASNVTANGGFYAAPIGQDSDTVYVLGLCRGDLSNESCFNCVNTPSQAILQKCPNQKGAIDWGDPDRCIVRCSDRSFSGVMDTRPAIFVYNVNNITNDMDDQFDQTLNSLVESLVVEAAMGSSKLKFATGEKNYTIFDNYIYALMQCTPDLSSARCSDCLIGAMDDYRSCCQRKQAVQIMRPSCIFQYDLSRFYESTSDASPPPPPPAVTMAPPPSTDTRKEDNRSSTIRTAIIIVAPIISVSLVLITCAFFLLRKREDVKKRSNSCCPFNMAWIRAAGKLFRVSREDASESVDSLRFDFATIRAATNDFSYTNKLGKGGFGTVYKGRLSNGQEIAVKRLASCSEQGEVEFKNEIVLMARLQHKNLVGLLGFCLEGQERLLIYEFLPNASLDRFIFDPIKRMLLNWETRYKIMVGIAQGILYLHEDSQLRIIHHDLKAGNVLLDGEMNPKISDFGMARLFAVDQSQGNTKRIAGTLGYIAPEYIKYGKFSVKTDVFSFGVLVLEIVSGIKNNGGGSPGHVEHLISYAWKKWREGKDLSLIDQTIRGGLNSDKRRCIHIGLLCVQENVVKRPTMASIVLMLNSFSMSLPLPSKPAFLVHSSMELHTSLLDQFPSRARESGDQSVEHPSNLSINEASITDLSPR